MHLKEQGTEPEPYQIIFKNTQMSLWSTLIVHRLTEGSGPSVFPHQLQVNDFYDKLVHNTSLHAVKSSHDLRIITTTFFVPTKKMVKQGEKVLN